MKFCVFLFIHLATLKPHHPQSSFKWSYSAIDSLLWAPMRKIDDFMHSIEYHYTASWVDTSTSISTRWVVYQNESHGYRVDKILVSTKERNGISLGHDIVIICSNNEDYFSFKQTIESDSSFELLEQLTEKDKFTDNYCKQDISISLSSIREDSTGLPEYYIAVGESDACFENSLKKYKK